MSTPNGPYDPYSPGSQDAGQQQGSCAQQAPTASRSRAAGTARRRAAVTGTPGRRLRATPAAVDTGSPAGRVRPVRAGYGQSRRLRPAADAASRATAPPMPRPPRARRLPARRCGGLRRRDQAGVQELVRLPGPGIALRVLVVRPVLVHRRRCLRRRLRRGAPAARPSPASASSRPALLVSHRHGDRQPRRCPSDGCTTSTSPGSGSSSRSFHSSAQSSSLSSPCLRAPAVPTASGDPARRAGDKSNRASRRSNGPLLMMALNHCSNRTLTDSPSCVRRIASARAGATESTVSLG